MNQQQHAKAQAKLQKKIWGNYVLMADDQIIYSSPSLELTLDFYWQNVSEWTYTNAIILREYQKDGTTLDVNLPVRVRRCH